MGLKDIKNFSAEEVGLWLAAQGLGEKAEKFLEEGVDGDLLLSLTIDDLKNDLDLSGLQAKKVMKNIEFTKGLTATAGGAVDAQELEGKIEELNDAIKVKDDEIAELKNKLEGMAVVQAEPEPKPARAPAPAPKPAPAPRPAPAPAPSHHHHREPGVVGGAARGAAGGALRGAIAGAILPGMDAGDGAAAGAAVGATRGGLRGIGARRRGRR